MLITSPSKSDLVITLMTPATASEPYTADAPPVITSTRSINSAGIILKSTMLLDGTPPMKRRPLRSTRLRLSPRLRRSTELMPDCAVAKPEFWDVNPGMPDTGSSRSMSCALLLPESSMASEDSVCTATGDAKFAWRMRVPVTTIVSSSSSTAASCAYATFHGLLRRAASAPPAISNLRVLDAGTFSDCII